MEWEAGQAMELSMSRRGLLHPAHLQHRQLRPFKVMLVKLI